MFDANKYFDIFKDIDQLKPEDTLQLILEARSQEERDFFTMIGNYLLQKKQKQVIERYFILMKRYNLIAGVNGAGKSTLCGNSILRNIMYTKQLGYEIEMHYVGIDSAELAKERIAYRVAHGGHYKAMKPDLCMMI